MQLKNKCLRVYLQNMNAQEIRAKKECVLWWRKKPKAEVRPSTHLVLDKRKWVHCNQLATQNPLNVYTRKETIVMNSDNRIQSFFLYRPEVMRTEKRKCKHAFARSIESAIYQEFCSHLVLRLKRSVDDRLLYKWMNQCKQESKFITPFCDK